MEVSRGRENQPPRQHVLKPVTDILALQTSLWWVASAAPGGLDGRTASHVGWAVQSGLLRTLSVSALNVPYPRNPLVVGKARWFIILISIPAPELMAQDLYCKHPQVTKMHLVSGKYCSLKFHSFNEYFLKSFLETLNLGTSYHSLHWQ